VAPCCGVLRSFLTAQPASPGLAPLASSHRATPPAFASAPRPGLRRRVPVRSSPPHHASGPRSVATRKEHASGKSFVLAERVGSRCRLRALLASSVVLVAPGASSASPFVPHCAAPCSLSAPAGTPDAAPSGGGRRLSFRLSPKQVGATCSAGEPVGRRTSEQGQVTDPTLLSHGEASIAVGVGRSRPGQARFGRLSSAQHGVEIWTRALRTNPRHPPPSALAGRHRPKASPPLHRPTHGTRGMTAEEKSPTWPRRSAGRCRACR